MLLISSTHCVLDCIVLKEPAKPAAVEQEPVTSVKEPETISVDSTKKLSALVSHYDDNDDEDVDGAPISIGSMILLKPVDIPFLCTFRSQAVIGN